MLTATVGFKDSTPEGRKGRVFGGGRRQGQSIARENSWKARRPQRKIQGSHSRPKTDLVEDRPRAIQRDGRSGLG